MVGIRLIVRVSWNGFIWCQLWCGLQLLFWSEAMVFNSVKWFCSFMTERICFGWAFSDLLRPEFTLHIFFSVFMVNVRVFFIWEIRSMCRLTILLIVFLWSCLDACRGPRWSDKSTWNLEILKRPIMMIVCKGFFAMLEKITDCTWLLIGHFRVPNAVPSCEADTCTQNWRIHVRLYFV